MSNIQNAIEQTLAFDPLAAAEEGVGKEHWSKFNASENLFATGLTMSHNDRKRQLLQDANDTHYGLSWDNFIVLIKSHGFKQALRYDFVDDQWDRTEINEAVLFLR